ncbi:MAG: hypothetical protein EKK57_09680 [Proteobacteria bacterium]|nr:MAG: hypothetical protein EKK57_09680 [Pseudomonadota bacterium]
MKIPEVGKLYFVPEENLFCIFRRIYYTRNKKSIRVDFYKDEFRKESYYDYDLDNAFEFDLSDFTFQPVVNKAEMRRRPFDFVDLDGAIKLITTKKKFQDVYCRFKLSSPVKFQAESYDWKTRTTTCYDAEATEFAGTMTPEADGKLNIKLYRETIIVDIANIKTLKFRLYEFHR